MAGDEAPASVRIGTQTIPLLKRGNRMEVPRHQFAAGTVRHYEAVWAAEDSCVIEVERAVREAGETFWGSTKVSTKHLLLEAEGPMPEDAPYDARPWADSGLDVVRVYAISFLDPTGAEPGGRRTPPSSPYLREPKESHVIHRYRDPYR